MKTTKTDEAESEDDLEEEYRKHVKSVLSFIVVALRVVVSPKRDCLSIIRAFCFYYDAR